MNEPIRLVPIAQAIKADHLYTMGYQDATDDLGDLVTAYTRLEVLYVDLAAEHDRVTNRRLWWDFWSFALGALAMAIVIGVMSAAMRW